VKPWVSNRKPSKPWKGRQKRFNIQLGNAVEKKKRKAANPPATSRHRYTREELDEIVAGTEKGIRDTHAWQDMVRRVGLEEARKILKLGLLSSQLPDRNPQN
jgi:pilus assembly protein TadC